MKALKISMLCLITLFLGFNLSAQNTDWLWVTQAGGSSGESGTGIAVDESGNSYVTGYFGESASFGSTTLTSSGYEDIFIAKMDSNGNWLWAKQAGGGSTDRGYGIAVDESGNSYVTGYFQGSASFGSTTLASTSSGYYDIFIAKMDSSGNWLWAKRAGGANGDKGYGIAVDESGNSYVTGYFQGSASFGTTTLTSSGGNDIFIAKMDSSGNWLWAKRAGGSSHDSGRGIAVDESGNSYVTGSFEGSASFGSTTLTSSGSSDIIIAKMDSSGNWLWAKRAGGSSDDYGYDIAVDESGNSYVTGYFWNSASFGSTTLTSSGLSDIFIAKLDSTGNWLWAKRAGGSSTDRGYGIAVDESGNSYVTGYFWGSASFGSTTLTSSRYSDIFIAKMDSSGNWLWANQAGGSNSDYGQGIAVDESGYSYVTGYFEGSASFGSTTLTSSGQTDIFIAKYFKAPPQVLSPNGGEVWRGSSLQTVYWDVAIFSDPINIKLSIDGGASWLFLNAEPVDGALGHYSFYAPVLNSTQCLILLESAQFPELYSDVSDTYFTITTASPATVVLLHPDSPGLKLQSGREYPISWLANQVTAVNLEVSYDWGATWNSIATNLLSTPATYNWVVPDSISTACYLRVSDSQNPSTYDWSDNVFTICKLELTQPNGAEVWASGLQNVITWEKEQVNTVKLEYSSDGGSSWITIANNVSSAAGYYHWTTPNINSTQCLVKVTDAEYEQVCDISDEPFTIRTRIIVESPNGGEYITALTVTRILWSSIEEIANVAIDYSVDNGANWLAIQSTPYPAAGGYYDWIVPNSISNQALVRVRSSDNDSIFDVSDAVFSIVAEVLPPEANFSADVLSGLEPLEVQFTDLSTPGTGGITAWYWDFGDGGTSTAQNPLYTYNEPGIYSVSLTVEGLFELEDTELKEAYITVIARVPEIALLSAQSLNFGVVYLGDVSGAQSIEVKNIGGAPLNLETVSYLLAESPFALLDTPLPIELDPDETAILNVVFAPLTSGAVSDSIYIHSDAVNLPLVAIGLRGTGQYVPPAAVGTPTVQIQGNDAIITWEAVTETIYGSPITPDLYLVLYNETPYEDENFYYFHGSTPLTTYTHYNVALFRESMFYRVVAVKFYREAEREAFANLRSAAGQITWQELKDRMKAYLSAALE
ncbi:MAG: hypothetical protein PWP64_358 [Candidatus Cloacimonadota bacterium]|nr:hypothetical protein [Candidatus Cloacimonadota bacterium]